MAINGISGSPAAGIDNVLAQLRLAQQRTQAGVAGAAGHVGAAHAAAASPSTVLRGTLSLSAEDGAGAIGAASGSAAVSAAGGGGFASLLKSSLDQVSAAQSSAAQLGQQFEKGQGNVDLNDVMLAMQKANVGFQAAVQVRNRLVSAYQTIMNMQI